MALAIRLMRLPAVKMHGPEHHFLVPAVLLAAYLERHRLQPLPGRGMPGNPVENTGRVSPEKISLTTK